MCPQNDSKARLAPIDANRFLIRVNEIIQIYFIKRIYHMQKKGYRAALAYKSMYAKTN